MNENIPQHPPQFSNHIQNSKIKKNKMKQEERKQSLKGLNLIYVYPVHT